MVKARNWHSIADIEKAASRCLPGIIRSYIAGGAGEETSIAANLSAFGQYRFRPRTLIDVSQRTMAIDALGQRWSAPFGVAPVGLCGLARCDADMMLARAARKAGIPFILSGASLVPVERVMAEAPESWFQAYLPADPAIIAPHLARLGRCGVRTLVLTVDVPVNGLRLRERRAGFSLPLKPTLRLALSGLAHPRWTTNVLLKPLLRGRPLSFPNYDAGPVRPLLSGLPTDMRARRDGFDWKRLIWLRERWPHKLIVKGILRPEDARRAQEIGLDGIIVSNHGGRQLDQAVPPIEALAEVRAAAPSLMIGIDGGIRTGGDIAKALALGADLVFAGRPFVLAAAAAADAGVERLIAILREDLDITMALLGCPTLAEITPHFLVGQFPVPPTACADLCSEKDVSRMAAHA